MKNIRTILILGGLPLLIYPFVLLADVMSLAGERSGKEPALLVAVATGFQLASLVYPAFYIPCVIFAIDKLKKNKEAAALRISLAPLCYFAILIALFFLWSKLEQTH